MDEKTTLIFKRVLEIKSVKELEETAEFLQNLSDFLKKLVFYKQLKEDGIIVSEVNRA